MEDPIIAPEIIILTDRKSNLIYDAAKNPHVMIVNPSKLSMVMDNNGLKLLYSGKYLDVSNTKYCYFCGARIFSHRNVTQCFEELGVFCFPSSEAISLTTSKFRQYLYYRKANIPIVPTMTGYLPREYMVNVENTIGNFPYVSKPDCGSLGSGVTMINDLYANIDDALNNKYTNHRYLLQSYANPNTDKRYDIRIIVYDNKVICAEKRYAVVDFRTNLSIGNPGEAYTPTEEEAQLAINAVQTIPGLTVGGVDIIYDGDNLKILEVNTYPGDKICRLTGINFYKYIVDDLMTKLHENTSSSEVSSE